MKRVGILERLFSLILFLIIMISQSNVVIAAGLEELKSKFEKEIISEIVGTNPIGDSFISAFRVREKVDGTGPFDSNNNAGNDASASNGIVRSFDNINYTLEYTTELRDKDNPVEEGDLFVEFTLNNSATEAIFDLNQMVWMTDRVYTYYYSDGTNSTILDDNKTIVKQVLKGKRHLSNLEGINAIPSVGTLSAGVAVRGAKNGAVIKPEFKIWMENNPANEIKSYVDPGVRVSAYPRYNVVMGRNGYQNALGYYNLSTGNQTNASDTNALYGRMQTFNIMVELWNEELDKGLKGVEIPQGDLQLRLTLAETATAESNTNIGGQYTPILWDISENTNYSSTNKIGKLGRQMYQPQTSYPASSAWTYPLSDWSSYRNSVYGNGNWSIVGNGNNTYTITIKNYKFNTKDWLFPDIGIGHSSLDHVFLENRGIFSVGFVEVLCQFPKQVTSTTDVHLKANIDIVSARGVSGTAITTDANKNDNLATANITLYPPGSYSSRHGIINNQRNTYVHSYYYTGDGAAQLNQELYLRAWINVIDTYDRPIQSQDTLFKFDHRVFEPRENVETIITPSIEGNIGTTKVLYAAKPNKTGWANNTEMQNLDIEDLVYFKTLSQLKAAGYICVGVLVETRGASIPSTYMDTDYIVDIPVVVKSTAQTGQVYQYIHSNRIWVGTNNGSFTMEGKSYPYTKNTAGYVNGYVTPSYSRKPTGYEVAVYNNSGVMTGGHTNGYLYGQSLLIIGYDSRVEKFILDNDNDKSSKTAFDMDMNERTVKYGIYGRTTTIVPTTGNLRTTIYIEDTIPEGLTYNVGSATYKGQRFDPQISTNAEGLTVLKWTLSNVVIGEAYDPIIFTCTIGKFGERDDVVNNQEIINSVHIYGTGDIRAGSKNFGNLYERSLSIIKLNAVSIVKETSQGRESNYRGVIQVGDSWSFNVKYANNNGNTMSNSRLYDVLPYNGDIRKSNFQGSYRVNSVSIDFRKAPRSFADGDYKVFYATSTSENDIRSNDFRKLEAFAGWTELTNKSISGNVVTYTGILANVTAFKVTGTLEGFEWYNFTMNMSPVAVNGQTHVAGNGYVNNVYQYANGQIAQIESNRAVIQIRGSLKVTKLWNDLNNKYQTRPNLLNITLYRNDKEYQVLPLQLYMEVLFS